VESRKVEKLKEANLKFTIYNLKFAILRSDMQSPACQKPLAIEMQIPVCQGEEKWI